LPAKTPRRPPSRETGRTKPPTWRRKEGWGQRNASALLFSDPATCQDPVVQKMTEKKMRGRTTPSSGRRLRSSEIRRLPWGSPHLPFCHLLFYSLWLQPKGCDGRREIAARRDLCDIFYFYATYRHPEASISMGWGPRGGPDAWACDPRSSGCDVGRFCVFLRSWRLKRGIGGARGTPIGMNRDWEPDPPYKLYFLSQQTRCQTFAVQRECRVLPRHYGITPGCPSQAFRAKQSQSWTEDKKR